MSIVTNIALEAFAEEVRDKVNGEHYTKTEANANFQPKGNYITSHQSLANYLTKTDAAGTYQPKGNYLTSVKWGEVSDKPSWIGASKPAYAYSEISGTPTIPTALKCPAALKFGSKSFDGSVAQTITAADLGALTAHQDLSAYAKKSDLPSVPTKTSQLTNDSGFLTSHQSLTSYLTKSDAQTLYQPKGNYLTAHQSLADYLTKADATSLYQPKGSYLTAHQSLANYVNLDGTQTISGAKTFSGTPVISTVAMPVVAGRITGLVAATMRLYRDGLAISNPATPNDVGFIRCLGTGESDTVLEIATGDDGGSGESIVFRGYTTQNTIGYSVAVPKKSGTIALTSDIPAATSVANKAATLTWNSAVTVATVGGTDITVKLPANPNTDTDTKNTTGSTASTGTKLFLVGASSQAANPVTNSNANCYVGTDNCLYSGGAKVLTSHQSLANYATKSELSGYAKVVKLTQSEYDALSTKDANTLYVITE